MSEQVAEQVAQPDAAPMETPAEVAQGGSGNDFLTMIPEDIREHPSFGPIKDVENLSAFIRQCTKIDWLREDCRCLSIQQMKISTTSMAVLVAQRHQKVMRSRQMATSLQKMLLHNTADIAHKLRLTPQQAQGVLEYYRSTVSNSAEQMQQMVADQASILKLNCVVSGVTTTTPRSTQHLAQRVSLPVMVP